MSQERFSELKAKAQSFGQGGYQKLSKEEQAEWQALKAEFGTGAQKTTQAEEEENISVPKDVLTELLAQIEELKATRHDLQAPREVLPGQATVVDNKSQVYKKIFKRFRDTSEDPWEYIADVKFLKFFFDRDLEEKVNLFKITSISSNGDIKTYEIKDSDLDRLGESVLLKITDKESKEYQVQDRLTPIITTAVSYKDSSNPKSVTGVDVQPVGPVKNMIRYLETRFTVHIPADRDSEGRDVIDTVNSPAKVTFCIVDNMDGKAGVHFDPKSIKLY